MSINPLDAVFELGNTLINKVWPDPVQQAAEQRKLLELYQKGDLAELQAHVQQVQGQLQINAKEAEHPRVFVAGWRPFVGWVGGFSLAYMGIIEPFLRFIANMIGYTGEFPVIDTSLTMQILLGMLGIGGMRSYDKKNNSNTNKVGKRWVSVTEGRAIHSWFCCNKSSKTTLKTFTNTVRVKMLGGIDSYLPKKATPNQSDNLSHLTKS